MKDTPLYFVTDPVKELLDGLEALGCQVERADGANLVSLPDGYGEFVMDWQGSVLYVGTTFMGPDEFADSSHAVALYRFLLELQDRSLGCHFACDRAGYLCIGNELLPHQQSPEQVMQVMEQIAYVIESCIGMCDQIIESGEMPDDDEVDQAFGISKNLH